MIPERGKINNMKSHRHDTNLDNMPIELLQIIYNYLELKSCLNFLMTTKNLYAHLENIDTIKILCLKHVIDHQIIQAIIPKNNYLDTLTDILTLFKNDHAKLKEVLANKNNHTISLYYANYCHPLSEELHSAFNKSCIHKFHLTPDTAKKNIPNFSSVRSLSFFNLPLSKIDIPQLRKEQFIRYSEVVEKQPVQYLSLRKS